MNDEKRKIQKIKAKQKIAERNKQTEIKICDLKLHGIKYKRFIALTFKLSVKMFNKFTVYTYLLPFFTYVTHIDSHY